MTNSYDFKKFILAKLRNANSVVSLKLQFNEKGEPLFGGINSDFDYGNALITLHEMLNDKHLIREHNLKVIDGLAEIDSGIRAIRKSIIKTLDKCKKQSDLRALVLRSLLFEFDKCFDVEFNSVIKAHTKNQLSKKYPIKTLANIYRKKPNRKKGTLNGFIDESDSFYISNKMIPLTIEQKNSLNRAIKKALTKK